MLQKLRIVLGEVILPKLIDYLKINAEIPYTKLLVTYCITVHTTYIYQKLGF